MVGTVFVLDESEPVDGHIYHVCEVVVNGFNLSLDTGNQFISLVLIEFKDALHLYFQESQDVVSGNLADKVLLERRQSVVNMCDDSIHVFGILELLILVDAFFDEDSLQGREEQLFHQLAPADVQFLAQQSHRVVYIMAEHITDGEEARLIILDDTAVGRNVDLAV